jgi:tripartite-type tricarboxylate transporter receptor subunit TctC
MEVNPSVPVNSVPEFIAYAKTNPGKLNQASTGIGSPPHLCGELFKMVTGVDMVHVPYRGAAPAVADLMAGQVQVMFVSLPSSIELIRAGKLRALAMATAKRWPAFPDLPTVGDFLLGFEGVQLTGIAAPKNTPNEVVTNLNREINAMVADPGMKARIAEVGGEALTGSPAEFAKLVESDAERWRKVIRAAHIKP